LILACIADAVGIRGLAGHARDSGCVRTKKISQRRVKMNNENLTIRFKVKDFNAWQTSYNGNEKNRTSAGITKSKVFRSNDDPNDVLLLQDVADVSKVRTWYGSSEMKSLMEKSGVVGSPSIRAAA
jgi:CRISPR/Cas system CSM-associated protein Csm5 (group 7 of RAMP superfamily)